MAERDITPRGTLILIGGAEYKGDDERLEMARRNKDFKPYEILKELIPNDCSGCKIEVITTATSIPGEVGDMYKDAFADIGMRDVGITHIETREDANNVKYVDRIKAARVVLFSGGDQVRISTIIGGSEVGEAIKNRYYDDKDFVVAGTSAGAMAMSGIMLYEGHNTEALLKGDVKTSGGLGLIHGCIIDTHFVKRGRIGRLTQAIILTPSCIGIGLGEDTALKVFDGNRMECLGSGTVVIIDGHDIKHTNITYAAEHTPLCVENLTVHMLCRGTGYRLKEREFIPDKK